MVLAIVVVTVVVEMWEGTAEDKERQQMCSGKHLNASISYANTFYYRY